MTTTELIKLWTMRGATCDVAEWFRSTDDIRALLDRRRGTGVHAQDAERPATLTPLLVRDPQEEEWRPLAAARR